MRFQSRGKMIIPVVAVLVLGLGLPPARGAVAPTLERALVKEAPALIKHFKARSYKNVGVLKFLVARQGDKRFSDNVGTLNMLLARRLEVALVLANDAKEPIGVIRNASDAAARISGANHRNAAGRKKLLEPDYPLAWGKEQVKADVFVTGLALISKDLSKLTVRLIAFDRATNKPTPIGASFETSIDAGKLAEMNESFAVRGLFDAGEVVKNAVKIKTGAVRHPLQDGTLPVTLEVFYDNKRVPIAYRDGNAFLPEPREGQTVAFRLRRDNSAVRYGVVLKVNGESTIGKERGLDLSCRRWIHDPKNQSITLTGYQVDDKKLERFRVLSVVETKERGMNYSADVGTISLTVFRERSKDSGCSTVADLLATTGLAHATTPWILALHSYRLSKVGEEPEQDRETNHAQAVARANLPEKKDSFWSLKASLLEEVDADDTRGLILLNKFQPEPTPVMCITLLVLPPRNEQKVVDPDAR